MFCGGKRKLSGNDHNNKYNCPEDCRNFVIKCSLSHLLPKTDNGFKVRQVINNIVVNISFMSIEASRLNKCGN